MKKIFLALTFFMALTLIVAPSYALIGIDDAVPGTNFRVPFIVGIGGGLDTIVQIQEVSDNTAFKATTPGVIHWFLYNSASGELADKTITYTGGDLIPLSIRVLLTDNLTASELTAIEYDLDRDGTNDHYVGYFYGQSLSTPTETDNLYVTFLFADLPTGRASGTYAAMYENIGPAPVAGVAAGNVNGYRYEQSAIANLATNATTGDAFPGIGTNTAATTVEAFTPAAYMVSSWRERQPFASAAVVPWTNLNYIEFTPRWYLHNAAAETFFIVWKNRNHNQTSVNNKITIFAWDEIETRTSKSINLPLELNIISVRDFLPPTYYATYPAGGWVSIRIADATATFTSGYLVNWRYTDFLFYTWTYAADTAAGTNWAALWNDRRVGTLNVCPVD